MDTLVKYLFYILLTWRITALITYDKGPHDVLARIRATIGVYYDEHSIRRGKNWVADMLNCHFCASLWIGLIVAALWIQDWSFIAVGFVLSAGSLIVNQIVPTI